MARRSFRQATVAALIGLLLVVPAAAATKKKDALPAHPDKLSYGPLDFEVPDAADYRHELSNGVVVFVAPDRALPLVDVSVAVRVGSFLDPEGKSGLAGMTGAMMREGGAGELTAEEFDERADFLAVNMGSGIGDLQGSASMNCITPVLDEALDLFFTMLKQPRFQQDRLDVEKDDRLEAMKQRNDTPQSISGREWNWLIRGSSHFSARRMTQADLQAIQRDDLVEFHKKYWQPKNMLISVSGDVDPRDVLAKLEKRFEAWHSDGPDVPWPPAAPEHTPVPGVFYVEKDIPQGRVVIGHLGHQRKNWDDPDVYALAVMNDILGGGGFTSRLVKRIRSDEGLAYSAGSGFGVGQYWPGTFSMSYQSKSPTVAFAAKIALEEMKRIRTEEVSDQELATAKAAFVDVFPRRFESAGQIAGVFLDDAYNGRPHGYWKTYQQRINAVTKQDVLRVAKRYLDPSKLVFLIVGTWSEIEPGDADGRASMKEFFEGKATELPLRDPLTLEPRP